MLEEITITTQDGPITLPVKPEITDQALPTKAPVDTRHGDEILPGLEFALVPNVRSFYRVAEPFRPYKKILRDCQHWRKLGAPYETLHRGQRWLTVCPVVGEEQLTVLSPKALKPETRKKLLARMWEIHQEWLRKKAAG
jgi:hypothetical protein